MKKVLHVSDFKTYLTSLQKLVGDSWHFILDSDDCFLCDKVSGRKISRSRKESGLPFFDDPAVTCLLSLKSVGVAQDKALMLHISMGPPFLSL